MSLPYGTRAVAESTCVISVLTYDCCEHFVFFNGLCDKCWRSPRIELDQPAFGPLQPPENKEIIVAKSVRSTGHRLRGPRAQTSLCGKSYASFGGWSFVEKSKSRSSLRDCHNDSIPRQPPNRDIAPANLRDTARAQI